MESGECGFDFRRKRWVLFRDEISNARDDGFVSFSFSVKRFLCFSFGCFTVNSVLRRI